MGKGGYKKEKYKGFKTKYFFHNGADQTSKKSRQAFIRM